MNLSPRLKKIADFVPDGGVMADVGTDHGHLPIYLVSLHKVTGAIAMDVRPGPLSRAQQAVTVHGLQDRIELRLADGLAALKPGEADTVVIAGMGGPLIRKILEEGKHMWDNVGHWILSPQSEIGETRHWLEEHGFSILKEDMVLDAGKYYVIMDVARGFMHYDQEYEYVYGRELIRGDHPVLRDFLEQERTKLHELRRRIGDRDSERSLARMAELDREEQLLQGALEAMK
ncbi:MAG: tRNA (adenine(22)-N(1))-methyltransferase [Lachnospiraceae bacterium]